MKLAKLAVARKRRLVMLFLLMVGDALSMVFGNRHIVCLDCLEARPGSNSFRAHLGHLSRRE